MGLELEPSSTKDMPADSRAPARKTGRLRKFLFVLAAAVVLGGIVIVAALYFATNTLHLEDAPRQADTIVVLGGEIVHRPDRALELYRQGAATNIIVSGEGDCEGVRITLTGKGVPPAAIQIECESRTTRENAKFTMPLLRAQNARRVIIVTSWFHSRRALYCFRHYAPDIEFISLPTSVDLPRHHWPTKWERKRVLSEYVKILYYRIRFGIASW
jgi:uncharacterized SAM-binding protein YcdF (DUF218 family)